MEKQHLEEYRKEPIETLLDYLGTLTNYPRDTEQNGPAIVGVSKVLADLLNDR